MSAEEQGVFVPRWAMEDCDGDARDAMVWAQITWWMQPDQRDGGDRTEQIVDRDDSRWLHMTDEELGDRPGLTRDQVYRARGKLKKLGLIECQVRKINGMRVTLTRIIRKRDFAVSETAKSRNGQSARTRNSSKREDALCSSSIAVENQAENQQSSTQVDAVRLCGLLADEIHAHRDGQGRPAITERWLRDMRLLLERGALNSEPEAFGADRVERCIRAVFGDLAQPSRGGFCWADQIRSPGALREHWWQIRDAAKAKSAAKTNGSSRPVDRQESAVKRQIQLIKGAM